MRLLGTGRTISFHELPLAGRDGELARLRACVAHAEASHSGAAILLVGAGGIGKTRLARALTETASAREWSTAIGCAYAPEQGLTNGVVGDAFCPLLRQLGSSTLDVITRGERPELAHICPALYPDEPLTPARNPTDGGESRARVMRVFERVVERLVARRPLLVVLENLHWADRSSLELAHVLARRAARFPLVLLGTYDPTERDRNTPLVELERSLVAEGHVAVEHLLPLSRDHVQSLIDNAFGVNRDHTSNFVEWLAEFTQGNPLLIAEALRSLVESGHLRFVHGGWSGWDARPHSIPQTLRDAVIAQLERLGPDARALADIAAVHAGRIEHDFLVHVSELEPETAARAIEELIRQKVLALVAPPNGELWSAIGPAYEITPPLLRTVVYENLGPARARLLHGGVAEALERHFGKRAEQHADELAYHFVRADRASGGSRALCYLTVAGQRAVARRAFHEGSAYLAAALEQADRMEESATSSPSARLRLLLDYGFACHLVGDVSRAMAAYERALEEAKALDDASLIARAEFYAAMACFLTGQTRATIDHCRAGLGAAERAGSLQVAPMLHHFKALAHSNLGEDADARREMAVVIGAAEAIGDARLRTFASELALTLDLWTGSLSAARSVGEQMIAVAREASLPDRELMGHYWLSAIEYFSGSAAAASPHIVACRKLFARHGSEILEVMAAEANGALAFSQGDWPAAREALERAVDIARTTRLNLSLPRVLAWRARLDLGVGDAERAGASLEEADRICGATRGGDWDTHALIPVLATMAEHLATIGQFAGARERAESAVAIIDRTGHVTWEALVLPVLARILIDAGDLAAARHVVGRLHDDGARRGLGLATLHAALLEGEIHALGGTVADASGILFEAISAMRNAGFHYDAARGSLLLADALAASGDRSEAVRILRATHALCARIGAEPMVRRIRDRFRGLKVRPPAPVSQRVTKEDGLTSRERELVRLVAERRSNKEIADLLDISPRTVTTHLNHVFGKLGIHSRGELIGRH